ncbi:alpha/beta hydrolase fold domain-containing protein [Polymorphobacter fuscus]|uniref:Alpha/beta hydrolase fold domain-containing protein n=2 Tax=Sandarakinorhabdus fusca TaxID=1439888 RepID=A0A7C9GQ74_9SPHN|nr:alpha/beta hydrolase [Polymorphobacter fuscus]MQT17416.1 alpha/beta hydrolase fold domain-containing protein [Polymorphobacter fuscus]
MRRRVLAAGAAVVAAGATAGCTRLGVLNGANALIPGDGGVALLASEIAYGGDPRQRLDIYGPPQARGLPVIVFFYGGSWSSGARGDYGFAARALAAQGFIVVVPDYRLVPAARFPAFVEDGAAATQWTAANVARHGGDPRRIAVAGHSAGAYIAMMLALDRGRGAAGVIKSVATLAGPFDFSPFVPGGAAAAAFGGTPDIAATQPINFARGDAPAMLLLTGDADTTVQPRNSRVLAARVTGLGGKAQLVEYAGIGHIGILLAMSKPFRGKAPVVRDIAVFLHAALAGTG